MKVSADKVELAIARSGKPRTAFREALTPGTYARIRQGKSVRPGTLGRIAMALGVDPAELLREEA